MDRDVAYAELGLAASASEDEVKAAWRRLVAQWHPDRNPTRHAVDRMQRINRAYAHLRGHFGEIAPAAARADEPPHAWPREDPPAAAPARTVRRKLVLTLEEAALGCEKPLRGRLTQVCASCAGRGAFVLESDCRTCRGRGSVRRPWYGWLPITEPCADCGGDGRARAACTPCGGRARVATPYRRRVRIPAGVRPGDVLHAEGEPALELQVRVAPHPLFVLGDDGTLRCEMPVDGFAWMANRWVDVPTLTGVQKMRLQRGHHAYRLRGQGFPQQRRGERGDYIVSVVPTFPSSLNAEQEALLDRLVASGEASAPLRGWQRKMQAWQRRRA